VCGAFGEGLIISPRDGPNIRQAWDGGWFFYTVPEWRVDALAVRAVDDKPGWFEDTPNPTHGHIGGFDSSTEAALQRGSFDTQGVRAFAIHNELGWTFKEAP
jgi:hypothetical protein